MSVDLERLADGYRHRPASPASLARADRAIEELHLGEGSVVVDVGGGPGSHAGRFAASGATVVVVDPAEGMWPRARSIGAHVVGGRGEALPLVSDLADLVWFHLSVHHTAWEQALAEAVRVCRGEVRVWTMGRRHFERSFPARWFPSVPAIDASRFPDPDDVEEEMRSLGLAHVRHGLEIEKKRLTAGEWLTAVDAGFISTLQLIPPDEMAAGIARFGEEHPDPDEVVEYELLFDWVFGAA